MQDLTLMAASAASWAMTFTAGVLILLAVSPKRRKK